MPPVTALDAQTSLWPEKCRKSRCNILQRLLCSLRRQGLARLVVGVAHAELEHAVTVARFHLHQTTLDSRLDAVDQRILQQRLQGQLRNRHAIGHAAHLPLHLQTIAEAKLLHGKIAPGQLHFLPPGN
ncbi:hypothetical protein D3C81_1678560 [compost metagenome]